MGSGYATHTRHEKTLTCDICSKTINLESLSEDDLYRDEREKHLSVKEKYLFTVTSGIMLEIGCYGNNKCLCVECLKEQIKKIAGKEWMESSRGTPSYDLACYNVNYKERKRQRRQKMKQEDRKVEHRSELLDLE